MLAFRREYAGRGLAEYEISVGNGERVGTRGNDSGSSAGDLGLSGRIERLEGGRGYGPINTALLHWKSISRANIRPTNVSSVTYRPAPSRLGHLAVTNLNLITSNEIGRTLLGITRLNNGHPPRAFVPLAFLEPFRLSRPLASRCPGNYRNSV